MTATCPIPLRRPSGAPAGSAQIEDMFLRYFDSRGLATDPTAFDGRSDYGPFIEHGVPAGGLFTRRRGHQDGGAGGGLRRYRRARLRPLLPPGMRHVDNLNNTALDQNADAVAHSAWTLARSQSPITKAQGTGPNTARAERSKRHGKYWKYQGPFLVR